MAKQKKEVVTKNVVVVNGYVVETANRAFADNLDMLEIARTEGMQAGWKACNAVYNIMEGNLYSEDFKTQDKLAEVIGISKAVISKMIKAWKFKQLDADLKDNNKIGYEKVYNLSCIPSEEYEEFKDYVYSETNKHAWELGDNAMRKVLKAFKDRNNDVSRETSEETKEEKTATPEEKRRVEFVAPDGSRLIASITNKDIDTIAKILKRDEHYEIYDVTGEQIYPPKAIVK